MSDQTKAALEEAIRAHIADLNDDPRIVTDWVLLTAHVGADPDTTSYVYECRENMPWHVLNGLIRHFLYRLEATPDEEDE